MTTRAELITAKYLVLETELKNYLDKSLFPSLDEIDLADLVYYCTMTFLGVDERSQYESKIREVAAANQIEITDGKVIDLVMEFAMWLKAL